MPSKKKPVLVKVGGFSAIGKKVAREVAAEVGFSNLSPQKRLKMMVVLNVLHRLGGNVSEDIFMMEFLLKMMKASKERIDKEINNAKASKESK